ncbi:hypothetical protein ASE13_06405 [Sphingomonas sp. Root241]|nr:hypothetical protein ASE13_06405 [Sphingomonas sp. Root241]
MAGSLLFAAPAAAQATRTWVSGVGDDVNPCSRTAPCKTFAGAISKTAAGGEINCLDPAGYGTLNITKSITIDCTGTFGSALSSSTTGFLVNGAGIDVVLRGLSINGGTPVSPGVNGIRFLNGSSLLVEDCIILGFRSGSPNGFGIKVEPSTAATVSVSNTVITNNGTGATGGGVLIQPTGAGGTVRATFNNVQIVNNLGDGVRVDTTGNSGSGVAVTLEDVRISGGTRAVSVNTPVGAAGAAILINDSVVSNASSAGLQTTGQNAVIRVSDTSIIGNGTGISPVGGVIATFGNNRVVGNSANGAFNLTLPPS